LEGIQVGVGRFIFCLSCPQILIKEFYQNEESLKGSLASISHEKEEKISQLGQNVRDLNNNMQDKNSEICKLQNTIDNYQKQGEKHIKVMVEINKEIEALFDALSKKLGFDNKFEVDIEANPDAMVTLLKTRRESLPSDFQNFYENLPHETQNDMVDDNRTGKREDFHQLSSKHKESKIVEAEREIGGDLKRCASLETLLKETNSKGKYNLEVSRVQFERAALEARMEELKRKNDSLTQENKVLQDECCRWKERCEEITKRNTKRAAQQKRREEKPLASVELGKLQKYLKQRRRSYSESQLTSLQDCKENFANAGKPVAEMTTEEQRKEEENSKDKATSMTPDRHFEELNNLESRLKQLSQLTEDLSAKIEKSNECLVEKAPDSESEKKQDLKRNHDPTLSAFYGYKLFSVIREIYEANVAALQEGVQSREQECCVLKEQLLAKERSEEVTQCYIESLKRTAAGYQEDIKNVKNKNQVLKRELRMLKDRVLVTNAEREMSVFYCKKNGLVKQGNSLDVESSAGGHQESGFGKSIFPCV
jgi:outer membrane murein-binding lipoprotein Lpp